MALENAEVSPVLSLVARAVTQAPTASSARQIEVDGRDAGCQSWSPSSSRQERLALAKTGRIRHQAAEELDQESVLATLVSDPWMLLPVPPPPAAGEYGRALGVIGRSGQHDPALSVGIDAV